MLTKESSHGFSPHPAYPVYEYKSRSGKGTKGHCDGSRMNPAPKGFREVIRYHNEDEDFADYLKWIEGDHKDNPDQSFIDSPYGIFIGAWRNARWFDEAQRRGLVKLTK